MKLKSGIPDSERKAPERPKLFAASMWSAFALENNEERFQKFVNRSRSAYKHFIESVLLHDQIIIPTQDFFELTILVCVLGERQVLDLLDAGSLRFLRLKGSLAYAVIDDLRPKLDPGGEPHPQAKAFRG